MTNLEISITHENLVRYYLELNYKSGIVRRNNEDFKAIIQELKIVANNLESMIDYSKLNLLGDKNEAI